MTTLPAKKVMVLAGEPSGEKHIAGILRELKLRQPGISFFGMGGDEMQAEGCDLLYHVRQTAIMGFAEVVRHLPMILKMKKDLIRALDERKPDLVVLVDYPGFNLRFAEEVKKRGIPVAWFISPQIWAWGKGRLKDIQRLVDQMLVILPFEKSLYEKAGVPVEFVGHPLISQIRVTESAAVFFDRHGLDARLPLVSLLPGSRRQEIASLLPVMIEAVKPLVQNREIQVVVSGVPFVPGDLYRPAGEAGVKVITGDVHALMSFSQQAVVASGTATLETALCGTPLTVVYKTSWLTYFLGRYLVDLKWISLVNIISDESVVPELIQHKAGPEEIRKSIQRFLDPGTVASTKSRLARLHDLLGQKSTPVAGADVLSRMLL